MGTCLKGMGAFRKQLLLEIIRQFGRESFSYKEASTLPGFDRSTFMSIYQDGLLKKASTGLPLRYSIISRSVEDIRKERHCCGTGRASPKVEYKTRGGGICCDENDQ